MQRIDAFVLDQRLFEYAVALDDIDEIIYDTPLAPHDQIEVAQSDVEIDHRNTFAAARESARNAGGGSGLSNSSLTRSYNDSLGQFWILLCKDLGAADMKVAGCVLCPRRDGSCADGREMQILACEPGLHRHAGQLGGNRFKDTEHARDRHEFRVKLLTEHSRCGIAARTGHCAATQRTINMEATVRHDLRTGGDAGIDDEIAIARIDTLARAHRLDVNQGRNVRIGRRRRRRWLRRGRCSLLVFEYRGWTGGRPKARKNRQVERAPHAFQLTRNPRQSHPPP